MEPLTDIEFRILDEVYFISTYRSILENVGGTEEDLVAALRGLLQKEYIFQMRYNESLKDFEKLIQPDFAAIAASSFVASRNGLMIHNSRN